VTPGPFLFFLPSLRLVQEPLPRSPSKFPLSSPNWRWPFNPWFTVVVIFSTSNWTRHILRSTTLHPATGPVPCLFGPQTASFLVICPLLIVTAPSPFDHVYRYIGLEIPHTSVECFSPGFSHPFFITDESPSPKRPRQRPPAPFSCVQLATVMLFDVCLASPPSPTTWCPFFPGVMPPSSPFNNRFPPHPSRKSPCVYLRCTELCSFFLTPWICI